ncbi:hypothetical protein R3W88_018499 [Solanum pinnatisectum]|uniref:Uncharacterized protein n=1 Tax=Solanum pinnatisectum TaxID=50273 RepID=A0AAV9L360_9SOLN|nr:hypothetical protein R3W88_018499 [Solanum pinnatisectum]
MEPILDNTQLFFLGDEMEGCENLRKCELRFSDSNLIIKASALLYPEFVDAENLFRELCKIKSQYVTKPLALRKYREQGLVIVEKIVPFDRWLNDTNKVGMWKIFGNNQTCLGLGHSFQEKFQQIMFGLQAIHKSYGHGNLSSGVFLSADGNILLSNFLVFSVDTQSLRQDFQDFLALVDKAITAHPMPNQVYVGTDPFPTHVLKDVKTVANVDVERFEFQLLDELFTMILARPITPSTASLLYGAPLFWRASHKMDFFTRLNMVIQSDNFNAKFHLEHGLNTALNSYFDTQQISKGTNQWSNLILPTSSLYEVLTFTDHGKLLQPKRLYLSNTGIIAFIRNYCAHRYFSVHAFNEIELIFPGITGIIYHELVLGPFWKHAVVLNKPHHQYQLLQEIEETQANVGIQSEFATWKTVEKHMMEEDTIW